MEWTSQILGLVQDVGVTVNLQHSLLMVSVAKSIWVEPWMAVSCQMRAKFARVLLLSHPARLALLPNSWSLLWAGVCLAAPLVLLAMDPPTSIVLDHVNMVGKTPEVLVPSLPIKSASPRWQQR